MAYAALGLFCLALALCVVLGWPTLCALAAGLLVFLGYGRLRGFGWRALCGMCLSGMLRIRNMLLTFLIIGVLTAVWRASGTIPVIVGFAASLIRPSALLPMTFLLCCGLSLLTGTAFGTAATIGVICATMGKSLGADMRLIGGAVLAGAYFGDRCSPVSTSALLVADLTGTDIYANIRRMLGRAAIPFALSCAAYVALGQAAPAAGALQDLRALFSRAFDMRWTAVLPAAVILVLALMRVNVRLAMLASILSALPLCLFVQRVDPAALMRTALLGYRAADAEVARMLDGGGVLSMARVAGIVCLSASYSGLFAGTGLLDGAHRAVGRLAARTGAFAATLISAAAASLIACNQTLSVMLTNQLCAGIYDRAEDLAEDLEDTAVVIAPLVPWSIAGAVPLSTVGAPQGALAFAVFLYLLPLCRLAAALVRRRGGG